MSKNDRVPDLRDQIAYALAGIYNPGAEESEPDELDYRATDRILRLLPDQHRYIAATRYALITLAALLIGFGIAIWF